MRRAASLKLQIACVFWGALSRKPSKNRVCHVSWNLPLCNLLWKLLGYAAGIAYGAATGIANSLTVYRSHQTPDFTRKWIQLRYRTMQIASSRYIILLLYLYLYVYLFLSKVVLGYRYCPEISNCTLVNQLVAFIFPVPVSQSCDLQLLFMSVSYKHNLCVNTRQDCRPHRHESRAVVCLCHGVTSSTITARQKLKANKYCIDELTQAFIDPHLKRRRKKPQKNSGAVEDALCDSWTELAYLLISQSVHCCYSWAEIQSQVSVILFSNIMYNILNVEPQTFFCQIPLGWPHCSASPPFRWTLTSSVALRRFALMCKPRWITW